MSFEFGLFEIATVLIALSALFSYVNHRYIRLPTTIGVMVIALAMSLGLIGLDYFGLELKPLAERLLARIDFDETLLHGMLAFLLFAGALHIELNDLAQQKWVITALATVGVLASTFLVGGMTWLLLFLLGIPIPPIYCLLLGALISPTDPIAVMGILKTAGAPKSLETKIAGESLFNDGVGIVVFIVILAIATGGHHGGDSEIPAGRVPGSEQSEGPENRGSGPSLRSDPGTHAGEGAAGANASPAEHGSERTMSAVEVAQLFAREALGGIALGLVAGLLAYQLIKRVDNYQVEVLLTLALVMGSSVLADGLHTSGPIAVVVAGLFIGNHGRRFAMSERTRDHLDTFWELVDEILNAVLFVLIGLEVLVMPFDARNLLAGVLAIPLVLLARLVSVGGTVGMLRLRREFTPGAVRIMTWGGLRGGISVALALSLPAGPERSLILGITYAVVVFSIIVQGLSIGAVVRRSLAGAGGAAIADS